MLLRINVDYYDTERFYQKKDCQLALQFTTYQEFANFYQRWKGEFDSYQEWEGYLREWQKLTS